MDKTLPEIFDDIMFTLSSMKNNINKQKEIIDDFQKCLDKNEKLLKEMKTNLSK